MRKSKSKVAVEDGKEEEDQGGGSEAENQKRREGKFCKMSVGKRFPLLYGYKEHEYVRGVKQKGENKSEGS